MLNYGLTRTWCSYTTHKSNVQWISISFVWLYVFKCDVCVLNCLLIKPKFFWVFYLFLKVIFVTLVLKAFLKRQKKKKIDVEKLCVWQFCDSFRKWMQFHPSHEMKWENLVPLKIQAESFMTHLQVVRDSSLTHEMKMRKFQFLHKFRQRVSWLRCKCFTTQIWPMKVCLVHLHISRVACEMCKKSVSKGSIWQFFKILFFSSLRVPLSKTQNFFKNSTKLLWVSLLRIL